MAIIEDSELRKSVVAEAGNGADAQAQRPILRIARLAGQISSDRSVHSRIAVVPAPTIGLLSLFAEVSMAGTESICSCCTNDCCSAHAEVVIIFPEWMVRGLHVHFSVSLGQ